MTSGLSAYGANFLKAYGSKRGEHLATKEDFESLKKQLHATTKITEQIKADVGHIEWRTREELTIRRAKLEEYVLQIATVASTVEKGTSRTITEIGFEDFDRECINRLEILAQLYFPNLYPYALAYNIELGKITSYAIDTKRDLNGLDQADAVGHQRRMDEALEALRPMYEAALTKRNALQQEAVAVMTRLMRVENADSGNAQKVG